MGIPSIEDFRASKDPRYNAKTTIAVTERVLHGWCARSDAYLWNVENCQARIIQVEREFPKIEKMNRWVMFPHDASFPYAVVSDDNLMYGIESTLKAAQLVDGYHEFNKEMNIPGFIENFEVGGLTYVYIQPTHRLDTIYNEYLSDAMKKALRDFLPLKEYLDHIYAVLHDESMDLNWAPGRNYSLRAGRVRYDSKRYTSDWIKTRLDPRFVATMLGPLRQLNSAIPLWFNDRELKARSS